MTKVTIDRELLERIDETAICDGMDATISDDLFTRLVAALAAPRQPEGEGLEVVAWQDADNPLYTTAERRQMHGWATDGYPIVELCRLSDHQRVIAELREECSFLKDCQKNAMLHMTGLVAERDTLRQQLAERDAQIASMRAEVTPFIETHWMPVARQRDKLAGLLRDERNWNCVEISCQRGVKDHCLCGACRILRIDAALAEVKPCTESPAPTTSMTETLP